MEIKDWRDCWNSELETREKLNPDNLCTFGIKPLDDALIGILPNDLVVIGADSGVGKSEICLNMALHNARCGRKVGLYFIEGGADEAIARIKWKSIKDRYYSNKDVYGFIDLDYRKWRMNLIPNPIIKTLEMECYLELESKIGDNLQIYSFEEGFKIDNLLMSLGYYVDYKNKTLQNPFGDMTFNVDLIIIDHLQYFTLTNAKNEINEMTDILMKVKNITNHYKIPVVLISHLRKKEKDRGLPSQEDFYGTSNTAKISSIAVTITPYSINEDYSSEQYPTFFRIVKSRTGIRPSYAALCNFDFKKQEYDVEYDLYKLSMDKPNSEKLPSFKCPKWARVRS